MPVSPATSSLPPTCTTTAPANTGAVPRRYMTTLRPFLRVKKRTLRAISARAFEDSSARHRSVVTVTKHVKAIIAARMEFLNWADNVTVRGVTIVASIVDARCSENRGLIITVNRSSTSSKKSFHLWHPGFDSFFAPPRSQNPRRSLGYACGFAPSSVRNLSQIWAPQGERTFWTRY